MFFSFVLSSLVCFLIKDYRPVVSLNFLLQCSSACPLKLFACQVILHTFFVICEFFSEKVLSGLPSNCQTVWIHIKPDKMSGQIWVQTISKGYWQMTLVGNDTISNSSISMILQVIYRGEWVAQWLSA